MPFLLVWDTLRKELAVNKKAKCLRPYHDEYTRSRLITEVKHRRARIVPGWVTSLFCKMTMEFIGIFKLFISFADEEDVLIQI